MIAAPVTIFRKTRMVPVHVYINGEHVADSEEWDETIWVERGEDWYALNALRGKRVRVVTRAMWLRSPEVQSS